MNNFNEKLNIKIFPKSAFEQYHNIWKSISDLLDVKVSPCNDFDRFNTLEDQQKLILNFFSDIACEKEFAGSYNFTGQLSEIDEILVKNMYNGNDLLYNITAVQNRFLSI